MKILFVTSEAHPLIKTGGLADVSGSLPIALKNQRQDVRLLLPAYGDLLANAGKVKQVAELELPHLESPVRILEGTLPGSRIKTWLIDYPPYFERKGNPYLSPKGKPWDDNATRFALFNQVAVEIAQDRTGLNWHADIVHCHDWQAGLTPALLSLESERPATVFTIHNLAYQGLFPYSTFQALSLPPQLWHLDGLEFYDQLSFIKGGLNFADMITTVSPSYAEEIQSHEFGCGLENLLKLRKTRLKGILNGVD
jgi:starch synthase